MIAQAVRIKEMGQLGVTGYVAFGNEFRPDMVDLMAFLSGRLMFNATLDVDTLLAEFLDEYYGGGETSANVGKYIKLMASSFAAANYSVDVSELHVCMRPVCLCSLQVSG